VLDLKQGKLTKINSDIMDQRDAFKSGGRYCSGVQRHASLTLCGVSHLANRMSSNQNGSPISRLTTGRSAKNRNVFLDNETLGSRKPSHAQKWLKGPSRSGESSRAVKQPLSVGHEAISEHGCCKAVGVRSCCGVETSSAKFANMYESCSSPVSRDKYEVISSKLDSGSGLNKSMIVPSPTSGCCCRGWTNAVCGSKANIESLTSRSCDSVICKVKHRSDADAKNYSLDMETIKADLGEISRSKSVLDANNSITRSNSFAYNNTPELYEEDDCELESRFTGKFSELSSSASCNMDVLAVDYYGSVANTDRDSVMMTKTGASRYMRNANSDAQFDLSVRPGKSSQSVMSSAITSNWKEISNTLSLDRVRRSWSNRRYDGSQTSSCTVPLPAKDVKHMLCNTYPGQMTGTRALLNSRPQVNTTTHKRLHEVETFLDDFKQQCSKLPEECDGGLQLNNVELRLLGQFESVSTLCRKRLEKQRQALITSEAFHSMVNKTKSMTSTLYHTYIFDQTDNKTSSSTLLAYMNSDFDALLANTDKLCRLKKKADQLIEFLHEIESSEKPTDEYSAKDAERHESWDPIVATVLTTTASNVVSNLLF